MRSGSGGVNGQEVLESQKSVKIVVGKSKRLENYYKKLHIEPYFYHQVQHVSNKMQSHSIDLNSVVEYPPLMSDNRNS